MSSRQVFGMSKSFVVLGLGALRIVSAGWISEHYGVRPRLPPVRWCVWQWRGRWRGEWGRRGGAGGGGGGAEVSLKAER